MRFIFLSVGTRGDVEPFCALAQELLLLQRQQQHNNNSNNNDNTSDDTYDRNDKKSSSNNNGTMMKIDFFLQRNLVHLAEHLTTTSCCHNNNQRMTMIRLHPFPFTNQDYYSAVSRTDNDGHDPRMKSVIQVADIIAGLVLPCQDQIERVLLLSSEEEEDDDRETSFQKDSNKDKRVWIVTSALARPLAFSIMAKLLRRNNNNNHTVRIVLLNLQPLVPNSVFPNYRLSIDDFVRAVGFHAGNSSSSSKMGQLNQVNNNNFEDTYWKLEKALEDYVKDRIHHATRTTRGIHNDDKTTLQLKNADNGSNDNNNRYYNTWTWNDMQRILAGYDEHFIIVNAYSNHLVPPLSNKNIDTILKGHDNERIRNDDDEDNHPSSDSLISPRIYEVGPLADGYLPPGGPSQSLMDFLNRPKNSGANNNNNDTANTESHAPPICIGFGSMIFPRPKILIRALQCLNQRAILVGSCLDIRNKINNDNTNNNNDDDLQCFVKTYIHHVSNGIPYAYLLPHCSMMICHGGAGVIHACLRAGIPCIVLPVMGDQYAWGGLLQDKGLGVMIQQKNTKQSLSGLSTNDIVNAIRMILPDNCNNRSNISCFDGGRGSIQERCRQLGEIIRQEPQSGASKVANLLAG